MDQTVQGAEGLEATAPDEPLRGDEEGLCLCVPGNVWHGERTLSCSKLEATHAIFHYVKPAYHPPLFRPAHVYILVYKSIFITGLALSN